MTFEMRRYLCFNISWNSKIIPFPNYYYYYWCVYNLHVCFEYYFIIIVFFFFISTLLTSCWVTLIHPVVSPACGKCSFKKTLCISPLKVFTFCVTFFCFSKKCYKYLFQERKLSLKSESIVYHSLDAGIFSEES